MRKVPGFIESQDLGNLSGAPKGAAANKRMLIRLDIR
jgi:hypothetical protein